MKITINGVPPSLNKFAGRSNTWEYRTAKKEWSEAVAWNAKTSGERYDKAKIIITYYFPTRARHDADNYCGKFLLDGLTQAGVIPDDDFRHITLELRGAYDKNKPRTEIEVQDAVD